MTTRRVAVAPGGGSASGNHPHTGPFTEALVDGLKLAATETQTRLVNRIGKVLRSGETYELRDTDGTPITVAQGRAIVAERFSIPAETPR